MSGYLLTWNPDHFKLGGDHGVTVGEDVRWSCQSKQPQLGDAVFLIRLGVEPRGIIAKGVVTRPPYEDSDWKDPAKQRNYIRFRVDELRPDCGSGLLPMVLLTKALPDQKWSPQGSGIALPQPVLTELEALWGHGNGRHSLRQYVDWSSADAEEARHDWLPAYQEITVLARTLRDGMREIDQNALEHLWRIQSNGVTGVGPGMLSKEEFAANLPLLTELTKKILAAPVAATLAEVEAQWQAAVQAGSLSKVHRAVIRRVFAAVSPQTITSLVRDSDCHAALGLLRRQFQLDGHEANGADWMSLNDAIVTSMHTAGLDDGRPLENNIAIWQLVAPPKPTESEQNDKSDSMIDPKQATKTPDGTAGSPPVNLILYGPPGTGKTYHTLMKRCTSLNPRFWTEEPIEQR